MSPPPRRRRRPAPLPAPRRDAARPAGRKRSPNRERMIARTAVWTMVLSLGVVKLTLFPF